MPDGIARILTYDFTDGGYVFTPVGSDDGTVFVHATLPDGGTEVLVYGPGATTPTVYDPPGRDGLGLVAGPNGPAYLLNTNSGLDHIMLYTVGGDARDLTNVPSAVGPRVVAPDGTLYLGYGGAVDTQTTTQFQVVIVKPDGGPAQLVQLSPNPADSNGVNIRVGTDNNAYVTYRDSVTGDIVNAVVEPDGTTRTLPFDPNGDVFGPSPTFRQYDPNAFTFGPDGRTYTMTGSTADTVVIHSSADGFETESTTSISDTGFPVGPLVFGPDGTAYLTLVKDETLFGATTSVWAITPEGATKVGEVTGLPAQGVFDGPAVTVGDDGHLYLTTYTRADAVDFPTTTVVHTFSTPIEV
jgi:WD40 repeat protein